MILHQHKSNIPNKAENILLHRAKHQPLKLPKKMLRDALMTSQSAESLTSNQREKKLEHLLATSSVFRPCKFCKFSTFNEIQ